MAFAFVNTGIAIGVAVATFSYTPANAGNLLVFFSDTSSGGGTPTVTSVVDNNSVSWVQAIATHQNTGLGQWRTAYYLAGCEAGITGVTVTYNGGTPANCDYKIVEYSGIATVSPLLATALNDQGNGAGVGPGTGTDAITSGAAVNVNIGTALGALILGVIFNGGDSDTVAGTGFVRRGAANNGFMGEDLRQTATGTARVTATAPTHGGTDTYTTFLLAFSEPSVLGQVSVPMSPGIVGPC